MAKLAITESAACNNTAVELTNGSSNVSWICPLTVTFFVRLSKNLGGSQDEKTDY